MSDLDDLIFSIPPKKLNIYIVADASETMRGRAIDTLNNTGCSLLAKLTEYSKQCDDAQFRVNVLKVGSEPKWIPVEVDSSIPYIYETFMWKDLDAEGVPALGAALKELNRRLSFRNFLISFDDYWTPVILFLSNGAAEDNLDLALADLNKNTWYQTAIKLALTFSDDCDHAVLSKLVGTPEAVVRGDNPELFEHIVRLISSPKELALPLSLLEESAEPVSPRLLFQKSELDVVFVLDGSDAMQGMAAIAQNALIEFAADEIASACSRDKTDPLFAAVQYGENTQWLESWGFYDQHSPISFHYRERFEHSMFTVGGSACLGKALRALNAEVSKYRLQPRFSEGSWAPILIFMGSGQADDDWESALAELKEKPWFQNAIRAAITFGDNPRTDVLAEITGDPNTVISASAALNCHRDPLRKLLFGIPFYEENYLTPPTAMPNFVTDEFD